MSITFEVQFLVPVCPTLPKNQNAIVQDMREAVIYEILSAIISHPLVSPPRIEVNATIFPIADVTTTLLPNTPTLKPRHALPTLFNPSLHGRHSTAWGTIYQKYPDLLKSKVQSVFRSHARSLMDLPSCRNLVDNPQWRREFGLKRPTNIKAALIQAAGIQHAPSAACLHCRKGRGLWVSCVTTPREHDNALRGSCANCFYNGTGSKCSFNLSAPKDLAALSSQLEDNESSSLPPENAQIRFKIGLELIEPFEANHISYRRKRTETTHVLIPMDKVLAKMPPSTDNQTQAQLINIAFSLSGSNSLYSGFEPLARFETPFATYS
ncbi:hypothetical protein F5X98DRAFT_43062 [Xylaria grammica]|nr:hypothetical protein F5X98DRAFT_43062 [Xylaria grammica]